MVNICAKISAVSGSTLSIPSSTYLPNNNISSTVFNTLNTLREGKTAFLLGCDDFSLGATLVQNTLPYYIGTEISNESGNFADGYVLTIESEDAIDSVTIAFDTVRNHHPLYVLVDYSASVAVNSSTVALSFESGTSHTIYFANWNAVGYPAVIQGITSGVEAEISASNLLDVNFTGRDRGELSKPSWGIYSNSGTLSFADNSNFIKALKLQEGLYRSQLQIFIKNRYFEKLIGTFWITSGEVDEETHVAELTFDDGLDKWQNIDVNAKKLLSYDNTKGMSLYDVLTYVNVNLVTSADDGIQIYFAEDGVTSLRWNKIWVLYPMVEASSYWAFLTKCCELSGSYIFCDEEGKAVIKYGGGT